MKKEKNIFLNQLKEEPFIEIFRLEDMNDTIFDNYQRYDFYQLLWFTRAGGNCSYFLDFNEYIIKEDQFVLIFPGQIDRLDIEGKEGFLFTIHNDIFYQINQRIKSDYLNGYFAHTFVTADNETRKILEQIRSLILTEYTSENRIVLMQSYMEAFLFYLSSLFETTDIFKNRSDFLVSKLMRLIDLNFIRQRENDFYAAELGVSIKKLNEDCKKGTGKTVKQHLQEKLILEIKKEIRLKQKNLKEIAFDLGFNEAAYFTRFFKKHTSMTPKEFRDSQ